MNHNPLIIQAFGICPAGSCDIRLKSIYYPEGKGVTTLTTSAIIQL